MSHLDNQKRQFTSRFYSNDITSFSNNDPRPAPSDSQLAATTQNLDGAMRGVEGPWSRQNWAEFHKKGLEFWFPRPGSVYQFVCPQSYAWSRNNVIWADWLNSPDIIYLQYTMDGDVMSWVASSVTTCHNIWPRKCMHIKTLKFIFLRFVHWPASVVTFITLCVCCWGWRQCTGTGHPGLRGDAELGMFNYAIVSAVTAAGSANTGAKKETNFIVVNIPISVPAKSFHSKLSLNLGPLVADLRRMCLFIWMISFSQIPFLSGVIIEWLQHPEARVKHNVGVIPPPAV